MASDPLVDGDDVKAKSTIDARDWNAVLLDELVDGVLAQTGVFDQPGKVTKSPELARFVSEWLHGCDKVHSNYLLVKHLFPQSNLSAPLCIYLEVCIVLNRAGEYGP